MTPFDQTHRDIETNERWLNEQMPAPSFSPAVSDSIKSAIRAELASSGTRPSRSWRPWHGAAAAAAMIALWAGLIGTLGGRQRVVLENARAVERFADAFDRLAADNAIVALLSDEIDAIISPDSADDDSILSDLSNEIEALQKDETAL